MHQGVSHWPKFLGRLPRRARSIPWGRPQILTALHQPPTYTCTTTQHKDMNKRSDQIHISMTNLKGCQSTVPSRVVKTANSSPCSLSLLMALFLFWDRKVQSCFVVLAAASSSCCNKNPATCLPDKSLLVTRLPSLSEQLFLLCICFFCSWPELPSSSMKQHVKSVLAVSHCSQEWSTNQDGEFSGEIENEKYCRFLIMETY
jgi:hypothetical protein